MKVGLIIPPNECGRWQSYCVKDSKPYLLSTGEPYNGPGPQDGMDNHIFRNIWNRVFLGEEGYFINPAQGIIDVDLDVVFLVNETQSDPSDFVNAVRRIYKNATIIGTTKENIPMLQGKEVTRLEKFFKLCDKVAIQFKEDTCERISKETGKKVHCLPMNYKIEDIRNKFVKSDTPSKKILVGCASWPTPSSRGYDKCLEFSNYLGDKYGYTIIENPDGRSWYEWLSIINEVDCVINMDTQQRLGQVTMESIILGTPHIGGFSDTALAMIPEWSLNDTDVLENIFVSLMGGEYNNDDHYAKLVDRYSFDAVEKQLQTILESSE